jgi:hypothetical protein
MIGAGARMSERSAIRLTGPAGLRARGARTRVHFVQTTMLPQPWNACWNCGGTPAPV